MTMEKRDLKWIELLRTFAMFLIVVCHAHDMVAFRGTSGAWWPSTLSSFVRFAVPLFFMISGYVMNKGLGSADGAIRYSTVVRRRVAPIIVNFFTWNIIYMILMNVFFGMPIVSSNTFWFLTTGYVHLYFIFVLMQLFLLYPLVHPFLNKRGAGIIFVAAALISLVFYAVSDILLWTRGADGHFFEWHWGKLFAAWCVFFFWGVWLALRPGLMTRMSRRILPLAALAAISFIPYWMETYQETRTFGYSSREYFLASGIAFQFLCANLALACACRLDSLNIRSRLMDMLAASGVDTYGIYLSHYALLLVLAFVLKRSGLVLDPLLAVFALAVIAWGASQCLVKALRRAPRFTAINVLLFGRRG